MSIKSEVYVPTAWLHADVDTLRVKRARAIELAGDESLFLSDQHRFTGHVIWLNQRIKYLRTRALIAPPTTEGGSDEHQI